jgi:predicted transcriptional regulator
MSHTVGRQKGRANDRYTIEEVIAALQETGGLKSRAARLLGCTRQTVSRYIDRYAEVREAMEQAEEDLLDEAEDKLREQIRDGQLTAIIFYLKTKGKGRGYTERVETTGKDGGPVEFQSKAEQVKSDMARKLARLAAGSQATEISG